MSEADSYGQRIRAIQRANQPILDGFQSWFNQSGWASKPSKTMWTTSVSLHDILSTMDIPSEDSMKQPAGMSMTF
jgi:hypothetical protein